MAEAFTAILKADPKNLDATILPIIDPMDAASLKAMATSAFKMLLRTPSKSQDARFKLDSLLFYLEVALDKPTTQGDIDFLASHIKRGVNWTDISDSNALTSTLARSLRARSDDMSTFIANWNHVSTIMITHDVNQVAKSNIERGYLHAMMSLAESESKSPSFWGKIEERLAKFFSGKTSVKEVESLLIETFSKDVDALVTKILAEAAYAKLGKGSLLGYVKYLVGTMTETMEYRTNFKKEWKALDAEHALAMKLLLKKMHDFGIGKLFTTSLENRDRIWEIIVAIFAENIASREALSLSSILSSLQSPLPLGSSAVKAELLGYFTRIQDGIKDIIERSEDATMENTCDLVDFSFLSMIDPAAKLDKDAAIKPLFIKWGMPIKKLAKEMLAFAEANADKMQFTQDNALLQQIHDIWRSVAVTEATSMEDYTFADLKLDLPREFGKEIRELVTKMRAYPATTPIEDKEIAATFHYYIKSARSVFVGYRPGKPRNAIEKQFDFEINQLLERMYDFSIEKIGVSTFDARVTMWELIYATIIAIMKETGTLPSSKEHPLVVEFETRHLATIKPVIHNFVESLKLALADEPTLDYAQRKSSQLLLGYFVEALHAYFDDALAYLYSVVQTPVALAVLSAHRADLDKVFVPFFDKVKAAKLPPVIMKEIADKIVIRLIMVAYPVIFKEEG